MFARIGKAWVVGAAVLAFGTGGAARADEQLKKGTYSGSASLTGGLGGGVDIKGKLAIEVTEVKDGNVVVEVKASNGMIGDGTLKGTVDKDGNVKLKGKLTAKGAAMMSYGVTMKLKVKGDALSGKGDYELDVRGSILSFDMKFDGEFKD